MGSNNGFMNDIMWTNLRYTRSREAFMQNFEVLNRKFT